MGQQLRAGYQKSSFRNDGGRGRNGPGRTEHSARKGSWNKRLVKNMPLGMLYNGIKSALNTSLSMLKDHNDKNVPFFLFQGYNFYRSVCSLPKAKTWSDFHDVIDPAEVIFKLVISVSNNQIGSCLLNLNFEKKCCCKPVS